VDTCLIACKIVGTPDCRIVGILAFKIVWKPDRRIVGIPADTLLSVFVSTSA
jgi:hypothetical protein